MKDICVFLCAKNANVAIPWAEAGYDCWLVDVQHSPRKESIISTYPGLIHLVYGDARSWRPPGRIIHLGAMPPCTHVAGSGARDFKTKGVRMLTDALDLFNACDMAGAWSGAPYWIENPVGALSSHIRKPDHIFQPWQYGDNESKATCLWTGNGFVMPRPVVTERPAGVLESCWKMPPGRDRGDLRSITPMGFARAVFAANAQRKERAA